MNREHRRRAHLPLISRPTCYSSRSLVLTCVLLAATDGGSRLAQGSVFPGGPLDELAHLLTALLVLWALGSRISRGLAIPALLASVTIDLDHLPALLGAHWLTAGTPRPYTHSLASLAVLLVGAAVFRQRRELLAGIALGLAIHFFRDLSEPGSGVALLWPLSCRSFTLPHWSYAVMIALAALAAAGRLQSRRNPFANGRSYHFR